MPTDPTTDEGATGVEPLIRISVLLICVAVAVAAAVGLVVLRFIVMETVPYAGVWRLTPKEWDFWLSLIAGPAFGVWAGRLMWQFAYKHSEKP